MHMVFRYACLEIADDGIILLERIAHAFKRVLCAVFVHERLHMPREHPISDKQHTGGLCTEDRTIQGHIAGGKTDPDGDDTEYQKPEQLAFKKVCECPRPFFARGHFFPVSMASHSVRHNHTLLCACPAWGFLLEYVSDACVEWPDLEKIHQSDADACRNNDRRNGYSETDKELLTGFLRPRAAGGRRGGRRGGHAPTNAHHRRN